jgi:hypothetical protein
MEEPDLVCLLEHSFQVVQAMDQVHGFLEKRGAILQMQVGAVLKIAVGYKELGKRFSSSEFCVMHSHDAKTRQ